LTEALRHSNTAELESLSHIEIDVENTYPIKAISVESPQIRTGGSPSSSHAMRMKRQGEKARINSKP
jgi:hypothetical protein